MPDSIQVPKTASGGIPKWLMIGGGIVAVLGLYAFTKKQQSGVGSTVAAGTSINAALGSLQEQLQQTQGLVGTTAAATQTQLAGSTNQLSANQAAIASEINTGLGSDLAMQYATQTAVITGTSDPRFAGWTDLAIARAKDTSAQAATSIDSTDHTAAHLVTATTGTN